ncbi:hypothetical protein BDQ17DRAFT_1365342 [Cyathus striatus]|nr:hypothetical protein BDQ17DRAFT_1365342 [Cyathus striatus]
MKLLSLQYLAWISRSFRRDEYSLLHPVSTRQYARCHGYGRSLTLRRFFHLLATVFSLLVIAILLSGIPPNFNDARNAARSLPQHNLSLARAERRRYLRFSRRVTGRGLNNALQQSLLMSHIAYASNRTYVFHDYVWSDLPFPYTIYDFALRPTRMPLNTFITGPTAGGPIEGASTSLRAVTEEFWNEVCPPERVTVFNSKDVPTDGEGSDIVKWWRESLANIEDECVEISPEKDVFNDYIFGEKRILSLWPDLSKSPVLQGFSWSPLVYSAVVRNYALLQSYSTKMVLDQDTPLEGLVAIHLRRGDYSRHCVNLKNWGANWMGLNSFPEFIDKFNPPAEEPDSNLRLEYYLKRCFPAREQIVQRLREIRKDNPSLRRVYLLSNGWGWWLNELSKELKQDGWEDVANTNQLRLDNEQFWVSGAVDMAIAERAEVLLGNGFSSLTSNVVMLRMASGKASTSNRFL